MVKRALVRGVSAGAGAGLAYGIYVGVIATPLIEYVETFESGGGSAVVPGVVATLASVAGGALYGILLGAAVFGVAFYLLEPALPGTARTKRYLLAAAGFLVVSGVPWLVFPPVPPGAEHSLPTEVRLPWYGVSMAVGAVACGLAVGAYTRLEPSQGTGLAILAAGVGLVPVLLLVIVAPSNRIASPVPGQVATLFTLATVVGQVGLWTLLATVHGWLAGRSVPNDSPAATVQPPESG